MPPTVLRRLAAMAYEALLVAAIVLVGGLAFVPASAGRLEGLARFAFQAYLLALVGLYFVWCWKRAGQTLAMKAWKLRVVTSDGAPLTTGRAAARFVLALLTVGLALGAATVLWERREGWLAWCALAPGVLSVMWGFFDAQGRFLYDVLSGTRLVREH